MLKTRHLLLSIVFAALVLLGQPDEISRLSQGARESPSITLVAAGDVLLDRGIRARIARYGLGWPFEKVLSVIRPADLFDTHELLMR